MNREEVRKAEATLKDNVICEDCGATLNTYADKCFAPLGFDCHGFKAIEAAAIRAARTTP